MTLLYILLGIIIILLWATMSYIAKTQKIVEGVQERLEDIEDVLAEVKANTAPPETELDGLDDTPPMHRINLPTLPKNEK
ncbi:hypothetical protein KAZ92_02995 [Candidatus Gracilibacteria bacterium]|nr:hypothetical protein [Candidatus Gracilibacteria bacterium]